MLMIPRLAPFKILSGAVVLTDSMDLTPKEMDAARIGWRAQMHIISTKIRCVTPRENRESGWKTKSNVTNAELQGDRKFFTMTAASNGAPIGWITYNRVRRIGAGRNLVKFGALPSPAVSRAAEPMFGVTNTQQWSGFMAKLLHELLAVDMLGDDGVYYRLTEWEIPTRADRESTRHFGGERTALPGELSEVNKAVDGRARLVFGEKTQRPDPPVTGGGRTGEQPPTAPEGKGK